MSSLIKKSLDSKEKVKNKEIEHYKDTSIYKTPPNLDKTIFKYTEEALYCYITHYDQYYPIYLRIHRENKYLYNFGYFESEEISEDMFIALTPYFTSKNPITEDNPKRNQKLGQMLNNSEKPVPFKKELDKIITKLINTKNYEQITHEFKVYEELHSKEEIDNETTEGKIKYFSFSDYPEDIQEEAKNLIKEDKLFDSLIYTIGITHKGDITLKEQLILVFGSVFVGYAVNTEVGGDTGEGKSDLVYTISENYPKRYIQHYRTFSPKNLYYDKDSFDKKYNIFLFDDVILSKEENVETIKTMTDNRAKVKELKTVGKVNGENKAKKYTISGKLLSILSYAKSNPDEELSNRLFKGFIDNKKDKTEVKNTIKKNVLTNIDNNTLLNKLNIINQCAIQYLIEADFTVFNPFNILFNPKEFNNRDVSSFLNLVNTVSFYHKNKRKSISFNNKKVVIGSFEDYKFVYDRWNTDVQKFKLSNRQEKILELLEPFDSEEDFSDYVKIKREEYNQINDPKTKKTFKKELNTISNLAKRLKVSKETLKFDIDKSQNKGNKKNLLDLDLIYRDYLNPSEYQKFYIYGKVREMPSNSPKNMGVIGGFEIYLLFNNLKLKISFLIYFINRYNILISPKKKKSITFFCSEYSKTIKDYDSLCSFLQSFMDNITDWDILENPSYEDMKIHFDILKESETFLLNYLSKNIPISKTSNKSLNPKCTEKSWVDKENTSYTHTKKIKEESSKEIDNKININPEISEVIQVNLEYYITGLTKQEIIDKFELNSSSEEYDYNILKIENTLEGLVKSNILRVVSKGFKQVYELNEKGE